MGLEDDMPFSQRVLFDCNFFFSELLKSNYNCGLYIFTLIYSVYPTLFIIFYEKKKGTDIVGRIILNQFYCEYKCYQRNCASETRCLGAKKSFVERLFEMEITVE